jgi:hypothetical protein
MAPQCLAICLAARKNGIPGPIVIGSFAPDGDGRRPCRLGRPKAGSVLRRRLIASNSHVRFMRRPAWASNRRHSTLLVKP